MILEKLDLILLIAGAALAVVSIVVNIVSSARLSSLSESINQFEAKFETKSASEKNPDQNDSRTGRGEKFDSSVLPAAEISGSDSRVSTRYRPPGSRAKLPDNKPGEEGSGSIPPTRTGIAKAGVRLPADEKPAEKEKEGPAAAEQEQAAPEKAVPEPVPERAPEKRAPLMGAEGLSQDDQALLQEYLKKEPPLSGEKAENKEPDLADIKEIYGSSGEAAESDVMEVVEDTRFLQAQAASAPAPAKNGAINPYNSKLQQLDMAKAFEALKNVNRGDDLVLDFQDVSLIIDGEAQDLAALQQKCVERNVNLVISSASRTLKSDLHARIPDLKMV